MDNLSELIKKHCVALTGSISTGKTTVGKEFEKLGFLIVDADQLAREAVKPGSSGLEKIQKLFGDSIIDPKSKTLNRAALSKIVFENKKMLEQLENITHPLIRGLLGEKVREYCNYSENALRKPVIYEAALIFEKKVSDQFLTTICTYCSEDVQMQRLMERDQISRSTADKLIKSQISAIEKAKNAEFAIDTALPQSEVKREISRIVRLLDNYKS